MERELKTMQKHKMKNKTSCGKWFRLKNEQMPQQDETSLTLYVAIHILKCIRDSVSSKV